MSLLKTINEASESHIKKEQKFFADNVKCLEDLIKFCDDEKDEGGSKSDYANIKKLSNHLINELKKHLESYE